MWVARNGMTWHAENEKSAVNEFKSSEAELGCYIDWTTDTYKGPCLKVQEPKLEDLEGWSQQCAFDVIVKAFQGNIYPSLKSYLFHFL